MSGERSVPAETPDDSPWRPDAGVVFDHPEARPFVEPPVKKAPFERSRSSAPSPSDVSAPANAGPDGEITGGSATDERSSLVDAPVGSDKGSSNDSGNENAPVAELRGAPWRWVPAVAAVGALMVGAGVWTQQDGDDRTSSAVLAAEIASAETSAPERVVVNPGVAAPSVSESDVLLGSEEAPLTARTVTCLTQRLPDFVKTLWTVDVDGATRVREPVGVDAASVVAVVDTAGESPGDAARTGLVSYDLADGREQWRIALDDGNGHRLIGLAEGVVILEQFGDTRFDHRLLAFDGADGNTLWERDFGAFWAAVVDPSTGLLLVDVAPTDGAPADDGSSLGLESPVGFVEVVEPATGVARTRRDGSVFSINQDGLLVVRAGDSFIGFRVDASAPVGGPPVVVELLGVIVEPSTVAAAAGAGLVVSDGESRSLIRWAGSTGVLRERLPMVGGPLVTPPASVQALDPLGGSAILVSGDGAIHGAHVGSETIDLRWRVQGTLTASAPSDRGRLLLVSSDGGSVSRVIDGSTGRRVVEVPIASGSNSALGLAANGVVVQSVGATGLFREAFDLDGRGLWIIPGRGRLVIGNRVVVDSRETDGVFQLVALGESRARAPECDGITNSLGES